MPFVSRARYLRSGARKLRLLRPLVAGKEASQALAILASTPRKGALLVRKALNSALASARNIHPEASSWQVKNLIIDEGPRMKRMRAGPMGRGMLIRKRLCHVTVILEEVKEEGKAQNGTKSKSNRAAAGER